MTNQQRIVLAKLVADMRTKAQKVGPMHAWWDDIREAEHFMRTDKSTEPSQKADALIAEFKRGS